MNKKKTILILLILALLFFWFNQRAKAQAPVTIPEPEPDKAPEPVQGEVYVVKRGDSIWKIAKARLPEGTSNATIFDYVKQISIDNGKDVSLIDGILTPGVNDPDLIYPGDILIINPFK